MIKSAVQTSKDVIDEPILRIEKHEDEVFKLISLVQNECLNSSIAEAIASIKQNMMNPHIPIEERRKRLSSNINAIDNKNTYETALQRHHDGTCEWALRLEQLQAWTSSQPEKGKLFWIHGPPGFGKTFVSAWIIRHLVEKMQWPVAYFFCVADNQPTRDPYAILRSWLSQLLMQDERIPTLMEAHLAMRTSKDQVLTQQELWRLWCNIGENISGCTFVVDGFDECNHINYGAQYHTKDPRSDFLRDLLIQLSKTKSRVLVVSRDVSDIRAYLSLSSAEPHGVEMYEYQITQHDTSSDVELFSESMVAHKLPKKASALRTKIAREAAERSEGMFLWIKLLENEISPEQNAKELSQTVLEMPSGISEAYTREVEKIVQLSPKHKDKSLKILRWILFAVRPLRVKELAEALIVSGDEEFHEYPFDLLPDSWTECFVDEDYVNGMILGRCGSLIELRASSRDEPLADRTVHFVHFSVKEYLSSIVPTDPLAEALSLKHADAEEIRLSKICLRYLTLDVFKEIPPDNSMYPFLSYAAWAWYVHGYLRRPLPPQDIMHWTQKVFDPSHSNWRVWTHVFEAELLDPDNEDWEFATLNRSSEREEASDSSDEEGDEEGDEESDEEGDAESDEGLDLGLMPHISNKTLLLETVQNPIYYASLLGLTEVLKWLEEQGLDCCCVGGRFGFPLQAAAARNQVEVVTHLLNRHVDVLQKGGQYGSALVAAAAISSPDIVKILLERGADINSTDTRGWNALHQASKRGSKEIVEILLDRGAQINAVTDFGSTAISLACRNGNGDVVSILIGTGADLKLANKNGEMPLHIAIMNKREDFACKLLDAGAPIDSKVSKGWTPLLLAVANECSRVVQELLELAADVNCRFRNNWTALHQAAGIGDIGIVKDMLKAGANITRLDDSGFTPLHTAAIEGHQDVMELLLNYQDSAEKVLGGNYSVPFVAAEVGNIGALKLLLDRGALVNSISESSQATLFDTAMLKNHDDIAGFLVKHGCFQKRNTTSSNKKLRPLITAADQSQDGIVMMAFSNDLEAVKSRVEDAHGKLGRQDDLNEALHVAAACGFAKIVTLLLENGAKVYQKDMNGRTALHHAVFNKHEDVANILVEEGAALSEEDDIGSTPLDLAVSHGLQVLSFIEHYMRDLNLSIKRRPSLLEYTKDSGRPNTSSSIRKAISGTWEGYYEYLTWEKDRRDPFSLTIPPTSPTTLDHRPETGDCTFSNEDNEDVVGKFQYRGFTDAKGVVWFVKLYEHHGWLYRGQLDPQLQTLKGTWGGNRKLWFGSFHLVRSSENS